MISGIKVSFYGTDLKGAAKHLVVNISSGDPSKGIMDNLEKTLNAHEELSDVSEELELLAEHGKQLFENHADADVISVTVEPSATKPKAAASGKGKQSTASAAGTSTSVTDVSSEAPK